MSATSQKYQQVGVRGTGRRKEAVARVRIKPGTGKFLINGEKADVYLQFRHSLQVPIVQPLVAVGLEKKYDVICRVHGGGKSGQADAIKMGLARALAEVNPEYHKTMRDEGFLTRDPRAKERKKYGLHRARKATQFSKR